jgi:hypothetical protein
MHHPPALPVPLLTHPSVECGKDQYDRHVIASRKLARVSLAGEGTGGLGTVGRGVRGLESTPAVTIGYAFADRKIYVPFGCSDRAV